MLHTLVPTADRTAVESLLDQAAFLFTGSNPVQILPDPAAIDPRRVAVLHGLVDTLDVGGSRIPLTGAETLVLVPPTFAFVAIGSGDLTYWAKHPGSQKRSYEVTFSGLGGGVVVLEGCNIGGGCGSFAQSSTACR